MSMKELMDEYFEYIGVGEAPSTYHRWAFITSISAALGRRAYLSRGHFNVYPNIYVMLMGDPGARKSTAIKISKDLLERAGFSEFSASHSSKERFLQDLEQAGIRALDECSQQFICADEFNNFMGEGNSSFISALTELFDASPKFDARFKNAKSSVIPNPIVTLLGGNTHQNFGTCFPPSIINNGFLSRMILVWGQRIRKVPNPSPQNEQKRDQFVGFFQHLLTNSVGAMAITPQARDALDEIYEAWEPLEDGRFLTYSERRQLHLQKLAVICSAGLGKIVLDYHDVVYANTLLANAEKDFSRALGEFGKSKTAEEASIVMNVLYSAKGPVSLNTIWKTVGTSLTKFEELRSILHNLIAAGKIDNNDGLFYAKPPREVKLPHLDFSLLTVPTEPETPNAKRIELLSSDRGLDEVAI